MGNDSDHLIVSGVRNRPAIYDLEDASFGPCSGSRSLIKVSAG